MGEFRMPSLGADMTEGTLLEWLVGPGDPVHRGQVIAVIDTVKSAIDIEAFEDGEVETLLVEPGATVSVGTPLAVIRTNAGAVPSAPAEPTPPGEPLEASLAGGPAEPAHHVAASPIVRRLAHELSVDLDAVEGSGRDGSITRHDVEVAAASHHGAQPLGAPGTAQSVKAVSRAHPSASPRARRRATELGIDLQAIAGTGPGGSVTSDDVEGAARVATTASSDMTPQPPPRAAAGAGRPAPAPPARRARTADVRTDERKDAMQAATAALMARSKREIPHYYLETTIDLRAMLDWVAERNQGRAPSERLLPAAVLLKATVTCMLTVPDLNGFYVDDRFEPHDHVDLGVAVSLRAGGLLVANIRGADSLSLDELMARLKDIATRARAGRLTSSEMTVPTVTVTNLGDQGADLVHGVIYPPQVALVGFGRTVERPWAVDGMLTVRPVVVATLAGDHRVTDGHRGSRFLAALDTALQKPEEL